MTPVAMDTPRRTDRLRVAHGPERDHLEALGKSIEAISGFHVQMIEGGREGSVVLRVVNRIATQLSEDIRSRIEGDEYWFTWSWGDTIGPAEDPDGAAEAIARVLTPEG